MEAGKEVPGASNDMMNCPRKKRQGGEASQIRKPPLCIRPSHSHSSDLLMQGGIDFPLQWSNQNRSYKAITAFSINPYLAIFGRTLLSSRDRHWAM